MVADYGGVTKECRPLIMGACFFQIIYGGVHSEIRGTGRISGKASATAEIGETRGKRRGVLLHTFVLAVLYFVSEGFFLGWLSQTA